MGKFRKIGILTSGCDAPGMNAVIRAVTRKAHELGIQVVGILKGYHGLVHDEIIPLTAESTENIIQLGGTVLYSDRCLEFKSDEGMAAALETCQKHEIDAIVAVGGDGTFRGATDLTNHGIPTIGITGTIDNDITITDYTVGFDTAMNTVVELVDRLADTCESHARCDVVEVMGRDCGQIALLTGIATSAIAVAIPEIPFDEKAAIDRINRFKNAGKRGMIVIVSEGCLNPDGSKYSETLAKKIESETGVETKFARLAHIVRGGSPTLRDRLNATAMGVKAVELLVEGKSNLVICEIDGAIKAVDINFALITDRMYKNKLKDGDLDKFTADQIAEMEIVCEKRRKELCDYYKVAHDVYDFDPKDFN